MARNLLLVVFLTITFALCAWGQTTGKLVGRVVDRDTREPLIGANVIVEGTNLGAATDLEGRYFILNVPVGTYSLTARYVGYRPVTVTDVRIIVGFTTEQLFALVTEELELEPIIVSGERPLVAKDQTGTVRLLTSEQIQAMPIRGFVTMAATTAGVVQDEREGPINVRGGRTDETGYIIDGVWTNDPLTGRSTAFVSQRSLQELVVMTGGYSAEYGNVMSGVVNITTRSGRDRYFGSVEYVTDQMLGDGAKGLRSMGSNLVNLSFGGPILPNNPSLLQFFGSVEYSFDRDLNPSWNSERLRDRANEVWDQWTSYILSVYQRRHPMTVLTRDMLLLSEPTWNVSKPGQLPVASRQRLAWNEKITLSLPNFRANLSGLSSRTEERRRRGIEAYLFMNAHRIPLRLVDNDQFTLRTSWTPLTTTFVEAQVSWFRSREENMDVLHRNRLFDYGDTLTNPLVKLYFPTPGEGQAFRVPLDPLIGQFALPGRIFNFYGLNHTTFWQFNFNITRQEKDHELKFGGELRTHELRKYRISPLDLARMDYVLRDKILSNPDQLTESERADALRAYRSAFTEAYGYDIFGRTWDGEGFDSGRRYEGPKKPIFGALFVKDKIELEDFVINLGLRFDYWNANTEVVRNLNDITNSANTQTWTNRDTFIVRNPGKPVPEHGWGQPGTIDDDSFEDVKPFTRFSPRIGFAFPVTDRTVFFAQFGIFSQMPPLERLYVSREWLKYWILETSVFTTFANPRLQPERTVQYEFGFRQQVGEVGSLNVTAHYKEISDLIQAGQVESPFNPIAFSVFLNTDYATVRGLDISFDLRRWRNLAGSINYTLQTATGTGSDAFTHFNLAWLDLGKPKFESPLEYDQRHTISASVDYRWGRDEVPALSRLGFNVLLRANSGRPYTANDPNQNPQSRVIETRSPINAVYSGWNYRVDLRVDKGFTIGPFDLEVYVLVINLLNRKNTNEVWPSTGLPDATGYLESETGSQGVTRFPDEIQGLYRSVYEMFEQDPFKVGPPRQVRLGLFVNL